MTCVNGRCTGNSCACTRPPASCQPAPLGKMGEAGTVNLPSENGGDSQKPHSC
jgi:hypothetical protein